MSGNKPKVNWKAASMFSKHVADHGRVAYYKHLRPDSQVLVSMVIDELLVSEAAVADGDVLAFLKTLAFDTEATVFGPRAGEDNPADRPNEDVHIWRLKHAEGNEKYPDVAHAVWKAREILVAKGISTNRVAPNHVLVPANFHSCPSGPPGHHNPRQFPHPGDPTVNVSVIDSGYEASSPIASRLAAAKYGDWFTENPIGSGKWSWVKESPAPKKGMDPLDQDHDHCLDALVAHANFVAGVVAQVCPTAAITVVSHNGAFVDRDDSDTPIPTEASVARSLWEQRSADVINVGFAFPTLPDAEPVVGKPDEFGRPSWVLDVVLASFEPENRSHVVVAPAGNQDAITPQYPAALGSAYPNVVGVASLHTKGVKSTFSNSGDWVTCSAIGEDVVSTFVDHWNGKTQELEVVGKPNAGKRVVKHFNSGWAQWSGTSFAAPKVAAAIAARKTPTKSALDGWKDVMGLYGSVADLGYDLWNLPPE